MFIQDFRLPFIQKNTIIKSIYFFPYCTAFYIRQQGHWLWGTMVPNSAAEMTHIGDEYQWAVFLIFNGGVTVTMRKRADELRHQQLVDVSASVVAKLHHRNN